ncbi:agouti-related protein isoform X1 [Marmota monax]|uniref:agouti-related protein isoform X1 n=1 Tax=Marmota monax TaxID=9995 RepID=UPI0026EC21A2|nr:agouti-related protein isoform X1 [Marmota monax]
MGNFHLFSPPWRAYRMKSPSASLGAQRGLAGAASARPPARSGGVEALAAQPALQRELSAALGSLCSQPQQQQRRLRHSAETETSGGDARTGSDCRAAERLGTHAGQPRFRLPSSLSAAPFKRTTRALHSKARSTLNHVTQLVPNSHTKKVQISKATEFQESKAILGSHHSELVGYRESSRTAQLPYILELSSLLLNTSMISCLLAMSLAGLGTIVPHSKLHVTGTCWVLNEYLLDYE